MSMDEKMAVHTAAGTDTPPTSSFEAHDAVGERRMGKSWM
jgi:hypothetical protein